MLRPEAVRTDLDHRPKRVFPPEWIPKRSCRPSPAFVHPLPKVLCYEERRSPLPMSLPGFLAQLLNGLQYGLLLFLISSGLTLIFGVLGVINLAHGSLYMIGAYVAFVVARATGSLWFALPVALLGGAMFGSLLERLLFRHFYKREHLDQVLLTFALILLFEEGRSLLIGNDFYSVPIPAALDFSIPIVEGFSYAAYRFVVIALDHGRACRG